MLVDRTHEEYRKLRRKMWLWWQLFDRYETMRRFGGYRTAKKYRQLRRVGSQIRKMVGLEGFSR
jgi:hypothetical protein